MLLERLPAKSATVLLLCGLGSLATLAGCSGDEVARDACQLEDVDGIIGGKYAFAIRVNDHAFEPIVITAQNSAEIRLTLANDGTAENGFSIDCLPTPNGDGCPTESCFSDSHVIEPIAPGASKTVDFEIPEVEGIYTFRAVPDDDGRTGQLVVQ